jgi:hypothetical protein
LPVEAWIEVSTCKTTSNAEAPTCERTPASECTPACEMASTTSMPAAWMGVCGHRGLCNSDSERSRGGKIPYPVHDCFLF